MEDYQSAYLQRTSDAAILDKNGRRIATMHLGGIAVECLLKYMIFTTLPEKATWEWKTNSNNPGHTITNPGHSYSEAIQRHQKLRDRIQRFPVVLQWLNDVENPDCHFIDMRYVGKEPDPVKYAQWQKSYKRLMKWLQNQTI